MSKKEIWYVWDGNECYHPDHSKVEAVIGLDGKVSRVDRREDDENFRNAFLCLYWGRDKEMKRAWNIAYTLGETRERVDCDGCDGTGLATDFNDGEVTVYEDEACPDCKGRGYIWEMEVAP